VVFHSFFATFFFIKQKKEEEESLVSRWFSPFMLWQNSCQQIAIFLGEEEEDHTDDVPVQSGQILES